MEELERLLAVDTGGDELGADEYLSDKSFYFSDSENVYSLCFLDKLIFGYDWICLTTESFWSDCRRGRDRSGDLSCKSSC